MPQRVQDVMSADPVTVDPATTVAEAARLMKQHGVGAIVVEEAIETMRRHSVRRLPMVEDGRAVGILSIGDLAIERDESSALADISAAPPSR